MKVVAMQLSESEDVSVYSYALGQQTIDAVLNAASIVMHPHSVVYMQISEALSKLQRKTFVMAVVVLLCVFAIRFVLQSAKAQLLFTFNATPPKTLFIGFCCRFNETVPGCENPSTCIRASISRCWTVFY
jgi:hypothetical protein